MFQLGQSRANSAVRAMSGLPATATALQAILPRNLLQDRPTGAVMPMLRGVFLYGRAVYRQSLLFDWSHSQIAVIDPSAISNLQILNAYSASR
jgi:hypothetical protein